MSVLHPIADVDSDGTLWPGAIWVGEATTQDLIADQIELIDAVGFARARLLVWDQGQARGFIEVPVVDGVIVADALAAALSELPVGGTRPAVGEFPPVTVAVCTRDRPEQLRDVLKSLAELDYPEVELLVVDNNPDSGLTPPAADELPGISVRVVAAVGQGLSIARNVALTHAAHDIVAFTDDDVIVDRSWLKHLIGGFADDRRIACVCGMVPSAELLTPAQSYFDRRVAWARTCEPAVFDVTASPDGDVLFPFRVAWYGTGANFAVRKDAVIAIGGFDEGMGIGSPTGGGEDIDMFVRVLLGGYLLAREPSAVVWHRHRRTESELETQIHNYGLGLGAWLTKLMLRPKTAFMVARRVVPGIRHLRRVTVVDQTADDDHGLAALEHVELRGVLAGPIALAQSRWAGRSGKPLTQPPTALKWLAFRRQQMWGDPENNIAAGRQSLWAICAGLCALLGSLRVLPTFLQVILVGIFVLCGPGGLALSWYTELPAPAKIALIPAVSISVCLLVVTLLLMAGYYGSLTILYALAGAVIVGGVSRCAWLARRRPAEAL